MKIYLRVINCQASSSYLQIEELYRSFSLGFTFILLCSVYLCLQNIFNLSPLEIHHFQHILGLRINLNNILLQSGNVRNVINSSINTSGKYLPGFTDNNDSIWKIKHIQNYAWLLCCEIISASAAQCPLLEQLPTIYQFFPLDCFRIKVTAPHSSHLQFLRATSSTAAYLSSEGSNNQSLNNSEFYAWVDFCYDHSLQLAVRMKKINYEEIWAFWFEWLILE